MTANAIAISRNLAAAGVEPKAADAIAEAVVTHSDESFATKADIARLEGEIKALRSEIKGEIKTLTNKVTLLTNLVMGLYVGLALLLVDKIIG